MPRVADRAVVQRPRLVHRHVDAVAEVVAERRTVEDAPAALVRYIHAVVAIVVDRARVHQDVSCTPAVSSHVEQSRSISTVTLVLSHSCCWFLLKNCHPILTSAEIRRRSLELRKT